MSPKRSLVDQRFMFFGHVTGAISCLASACVVLIGCARSSQSNFVPLPTQSFGTSGPYATVAQPTNPAPNYAAQSTATPAPAAVAPIPTQPPAPGSPPSPFVNGSGAFQPGLQDDGSMVIPSDGTASAFQLSAPLVPCGYDMHGEYPKLKQDRAALSQLIARTTIDFQFFQDNCPQYYPMMKRPTLGLPLTETERITNFIQAEQCRFDPYYSKGYWIPEAIELIDVCAVTLGGDWHVPTERELLQMTQTQRQKLANPPLPKGVSLGSSHGLTVYVRRNDGRLAIGQLQGGSFTDFAQRSIFPGQAKPAQTSAPSSHYEGGVLLRCLRAPSSPAPAHPQAATCQPSAKGGGRPWRTEYSQAVTSPQTSPERQEFERRLEFSVKQFEQQTQYAQTMAKTGRDLGEPCRQAVDSLSRVSDELRAINRGHLVLPTWKDPLGSPVIARFRAAAARLVPIVRQQAAETQEILDYCARQPKIPPCKTEVIAPQRTLHSSHQEALRHLGVILGTK